MYVICICMCILDTFMHVYALYQQFSKIIHILSTTECAPMYFDIDVDVSCNLMDSHPN